MQNWRFTAFEEKWGYKPWGLEQKEPKSVRNAVRHEEHDSCLFQLRPAIRILRVHTTHTWLIFIFVSIYWSLLVWFFLDCIIVVRWRVQVPDCALMRKIGVVEEAVARFSTYILAWEISEGIHLKGFVIKDKGAAIDWRILSGIVDKHWRIQLVSYSLFEMFQSLSKKSWVFRYVKQFIQFFPGHLNIPVIIMRIASILIDSPFFFSPQKTTTYKVNYRYILVIFWVDVRVCG